MGRVRGRVMSARAMWILLHPYIGIASSFDVRLGAAEIVQEYYRCEMPREAMREADRVARPSMVVAAGCAGSRGNCSC